MAIGDAPVETALVMVGAQPRSRPGMEGRKEGPGRGPAPGPDDGAKGVGGMGDRRWVGMGVVDGPIQNGRFRVTTVPFCVPLWQRFWQALWSDESVSFSLDAKGGVSRRLPLPPFAGGGGGGKAG